jgi:tryptophan synthase alpha chain
MSKIAKAFRDNKKAFIPFITAGDPSLAKTRDADSDSRESGAAVVEIGIPFSDPVAEGEVIQRANSRALAAGCTTDKIFDMLLELRQVSQVPIAFLPTSIPSLLMGVTDFSKNAGKQALTGLLFPMCPLRKKES